MSTNISNERNIPQPSDANPTEVPAGLDPEIMILAEKISGALRRLLELERTVTAGEEYQTGWVDGAAETAARWSAAQDLADTSEDRLQRAYLGGYARGYVDACEAQGKDTHPVEERDEARLSLGRGFVAGIRAIEHLAAGRSAQDPPPALSTDELVTRMPWLFDALLAGSPDPAEWPEEAS